MGTPRIRAPVASAAAADDLFTLTDSGVEPTHALTLKAGIDGALVVWEIS